MEHLRRESLLITTLYNMFYNLGPINDNHDRYEIERFEDLKIFGDLLCLRFLMRKMSWCFESNKNWDSRNETYTKDS